MRKVTLEKIKSADITAPDLVHIRNGRLARIPGFDPFLAIWVYVLRQLGCEESTIEFYFLDLQNLIAIVTQLSKRTFSIHQIDEMAEWLFPALSSAYAVPGTGEGRAKIQRTLTALRQFCRLLHIRFNISCDRILHWKWPKSNVENAKRIPPTTDWDEAMAYLATLRGWQSLRDVAALRLVRCALMSLTEIVVLNANDLDREGGKLFVYRSRSAIARGCQSPIQSSGKTSKHIGDYVRSVQFLTVHCSFISTDRVFVRLASGT